MVLGVRLLELRRCMPQGAKHGMVGRPEITSRERQPARKILRSRRRHTAAVEKRLLCASTATKQQPSPIAVTQTLTGAMNHRRHVAGKRFAHPPGASTNAHKRRSTDLRSRLAARGCRRHRSRHSRRTPHFPDLVRELRELKDRQPGREDGFVVMPRVHTITARSAFHPKQHQHMLALPRRIT